MNGYKIEPKHGNATKKLPLTAISFGLFYSFYLTYYSNFANSPVAEAARKTGASADALNLCLLLLFAVGIVCGLTSVWTRWFIRNRRIKRSVHIFAFLAPLLLPLAPTAPFVYICTILVAFCVGALMGRSIYTAVCFSADIHPALMIVAIYTVVQAYIHAYAIAPALRSLPMYYALGAPVLLAGAITCYLFDGNEMERRRVLPEKRLRLEDLWPALVMIVFAQASFALYETVLLPRIPALPLDPVWQIVPNAATLLFFLLFGQRLNFRGALTVMAVLFAGGAVVFLAWVGPGRVFAQMFTESAFLFYDLFYIWLMRYIFLAYGRRFARMKLFIIIDFSVGLAFKGFAEILFSNLPPGAGIAIALLPLAFGLALLIPSTVRAAEGMDAQRAYAESFDALEVPLPDQRGDVLKARNALLRTLPPGATLTDEEQTALAYLIDGQYADLTAYFMDVSTGRVHALTGSVVAKFGCKNKTELIARMGAARTEDDRRARIEALYEEYGLTAREREISELLMTTGLAMKHISEKLSLSDDTVRTHAKNLYRKFGIQSRAELAEKLTGIG
jgi:DNA-binding CsgD family transcriptional regulator